MSYFQSQTVTCNLQVMIQVIFFFFKQRINLCVYVSLPLTVGQEMFAQVTVHSCSLYYSCFLFCSFENFQQKLRKIEKDENQNFKTILNGFWRKRKNSQISSEIKHKYFFIYGISFYTNSIKT